MFRLILPVVRSARPLVNTYLSAAKFITNDMKSFSTINKHTSIWPSSCSLSHTSLVKNKQILDIANNVSVVPARTVIKFSLNSGKRKTVKAVIRRFYRLHWGGWIRTKCGRNKHLWKKSEKRKRRARQHVLCNATQSTLLDKMVTKFWKKPKFYIDDPYAPYHTREEFNITRKKPLRRR